MYKCPRSLNKAERTATIRHLLDHCVAFACGGGIYIYIVPPILRPLLCSGLHAHV